MENLAIFESVFEIPIRNVSHNLSINEMAELEKRLVKRFSITESEIAYLESLRDDIKAVKTVQDAEIMLDRLVENKGPGFLLRHIGAACYLIAFCGGFATSWALFGQFVGTGSLGTAVGSVGAAMGISGSVWLTLKSAFMLILSTMGIMFMSIGVGRAVHWLFKAACEKFLNVRFETAGQRTSNFKAFIAVLDENILIAKKAGNLEEAKEFEFIRDRAILKLRQR